MRRLDFYWLISRQFSLSLQITPWESLWPRKAPIQDAINAHLHTSIYLFLLSKKKKSCLIFSVALFLPRIENGENPRNRAPSEDLWLGSDGHFWNPLPPQVLKEVCLNLKIIMWDLQSSDLLLFFEFHFLFFDCSCSCSCSWFLFKWMCVGKLGSVMFSSRFCTVVFAIQICTWSRMSGGLLSTPSFLGKILSFSSRVSFYLREREREKEWWSSL